MRCSADTQTSSKEVEAPPKVPFIYMKAHQKDQEHTDNAGEEEEEEDVKEEEGGREKKDILDGTILATFAIIKGKTLCLKSLHG